MPMSTDRSLWKRKCDVSRIFNFENLSQLDNKILKIAILFKSYYCIIYFKIHIFLLTLDLLKHDIEYFCVPYIFHSYQYSKTKTSGHKVFFYSKIAFNICWDYRDVMDLLLDLIFMGDKTKHFLKTSLDFKTLNIPLGYRCLIYINFYTVLNINATLCSKVIWFYFNAFERDSSQTT